MLRKTVLQLCAVAFVLTFGDARAADLPRAILDKIPLGFTVLTHASGELNVDPFKDYLVVVKNGVRHEWHLLKCWRSLKFDHPCSFKIDQSSKAFPQRNTIEQAANPAQNSIRKSPSIFSILDARQHARQHIAAKKVIFTGLEGIASVLFPSLLK